DLAGCRMSRRIQVHDHLIRSWRICHEKRFNVDEMAYRHCVKKLLVWYLLGPRQGPLSLHDLLSKICDITLNPLECVDDKCQSEAGLNSSLCDLTTLSLPISC